VLPRRPPTTSPARRRPPTHPSQRRELQQQAQQLSEAAAALANEPSSPAGAEREPLVLHYSVRPRGVHAGDAPPLEGPTVEQDQPPVGLGDGSLLGQVDSVEAGQASGWACLRGAPGADLQARGLRASVRASVLCVPARGPPALRSARPAPSIHSSPVSVHAFPAQVVVYIDGVRAAAAAAAGSHPRAATLGRLCGLDTDGTGGPAWGLGFVAQLPPLDPGMHEASAAPCCAPFPAAALHARCPFACRLPTRGRGCTKPAPAHACPRPPAPAPCPSLQLRAFVVSPRAAAAETRGAGAGGAYRQELHQSPLLFKESAVHPDQEEALRRKDAIILLRLVGGRAGAWWGAVECASRRASASRQASWAGGTCTGHVLGGMKEG
jgi:hypothetical protein